VLLFHHFIVCFFLPFPFSSEILDEDLQQLSVLWLEGLSEIFAVHDLVYIGGLHGLEDIFRLLNGRGYVGAVLLGLLLCPPTCLPVPLVVFRLL